MLLVDDKVSMSPVAIHTHTPHQMTTKVTICNHRADSSRYVWFGDLQVWKSVVKHDTKCPYSVLAHKWNQILSLYDVIFLQLGGFLREKDHGAQYFVTHTLRVLFYKAHQNFP